MMRAVSDNYTQEVRISKSDISSYFMSINKHILLDLVQKLLKNNEQNQEYLFKRLQNILQIIINHDPTKNYYRIGDKKQRENFPKHKSLFASKP